MDPNSWFEKHDGKFCILSPEVLCHDTRRGEGRFVTNKVKELGDAYPALDSNNVDPVFESKFNIELQLFDYYDKLYFVSEIIVLDDGDSRFQGRLFGFYCHEVHKGTIICEESHLYFENPEEWEEFMLKSRENEAEIHPGSSILVQISDEQSPPKRSFTLSSHLATKDSNVIRDFYKKAPQSQLLPKLETIVNYLNLASTTKKDSQDVLSIIKERICTQMPDQLWTSFKYLIPFNETNKRVYIKIDGLVNMDGNIILCRFVLNPHPLKEKRPVYNISVPDLESTTVFQFNEGSEVVLDLKELSEYLCLVFILTKVEFDEGGSSKEAVRFEDCGFGLLPIRNDVGFLNFGKMLLPTFSTSVGWKSLEEFSNHKAWDLLEAFLDDDDEVSLSNKYIVVSVRDEYRKDFYQDFDDFQKIEYDYIDPKGEDTAVKLNPAAMNELWQDAVAGHTQYLKDLLPESLDPEDFYQQVEEFYKTNPL